MSANYRVYIDEAGDDGFSFKPDGRGSSRWLVLSAVVVRAKRDHDLIRNIAETRTLLGKPTNHPLHFRKLDHAPCKAWAAKLATAPVRTMSVVANKEHPSTSAKFSGNKDLFYRYLIRLLLERVSWFCRDNEEPAAPGCLTDITFSNRGSMSYQEVRNYLDLLKANPAHQCKIHWPAIDPQQVKAIPHTKIAGLQAADAVASAIYSAVQPNRFGQVEPSYVKELKPILYRHNGILWSYGLKWWPFDFDQMKAANPFLVELAAL